MVKMESSQMRSTIRDYQSRYQNLQSVVTSVAPINRIGYQISPDNQQFNCIGIGISMSDKQILLVRMRITHLLQIVHCWLYCLASWLTQSLGRRCLSWSTLWWEKTPSSHYVGSVSNPFRTVGVTQRCTSLQTEFSI